MAEGACSVQAAPALCISMSLVLDPALIRTEGRPRKPFQGWRYLAAADAPPDLSGPGESATGLPQDLERALGRLGLVEK